MVGMKKFRRSNFNRGSKKSVRKFFWAMTILGRIFFALKNSTFWDFLRQLKGHHFRAFISLSTLKPLRGHAARARAAYGRPWRPAAAHG